MRHLLCSLLRRRDEVPWTAAKSAASSQLPLTSLPSLEISPVEPRAVAWILPGLLRHSDIPPETAGSCSGTDLGIMWFELSEPHGIALIRLSSYVDRFSGVAQNAFSVRSTGIRIGNRDRSGRLSSQ